MNNIKTIDDYEFKPVLKPDWFLFKPGDDSVDLEKYYYLSMAEIMKVVRNDNREDWEKLAELGFHLFNLNMLIESNVMFDYRYEVLENKKVCQMFDYLAEGVVDPMAFIKYTTDVRDDLQKEVVKLATKVGNDIFVSGLLCDINDRNKFIHDKEKAIPVFYNPEHGQISMFSFYVSNDHDLYLNYSNTINFRGDDCVEKFKKFARNKSAFFTKSKSMVIYTLPNYDLRKAAGYFYVMYIFNAWMNRTEKFNPNIISDVVAKMDEDDVYFSFSADL